MRLPLPCSFIPTRRFGAIILLLPALYLCAGSARADKVYLQDGSRLVGHVVSYAGGTLRIETGFAGTLEVPAAQIKGLTLDKPVLATLSTGDRLNARLKYKPRGGQTLKSPSFGLRKLADNVSVTAIGSGGAAPQQSGSEAVDMSAVFEPEPDPWSGSVSFGLDGASGNTRRFGLNGRGEVRRETDGDRLMLYAQGTLQREDGATTAKQILAGGDLERDIDQQWFVFGSTDFEKDPFQDLDLRAIANVGVGYFLARTDALKWKGLLGAGYQHETYIGGDIQQEGIISLGWDLSYNYNKWLKLMHDLTYYPSLSSPSKQYRLVSDLSAQVPLANTRNWKLRFSLRNQYDNSPRPGVKKLDTNYSLNLVYDFE